MVENFHRRSGHFTSSEKHFMYNPRPVNICLRQMTSAICLKQLAIAIHRNLQARMMFISMATQQPCGFENPMYGSRTTAQSVSDRRD